MAYEPQNIYYHDQRGYHRLRSQLACSHSKPRKEKYVSVNIAPGVLAGQSSARHFNLDAI